MATGNEHSDEFDTVKNGEPMCGLAYVSQGPQKGLQARLKAEEDAAKTRAEARCVRCLRPINWDKHRPKRPWASDDEALKALDDPSFRLIYHDIILIWFCAVVVIGIVAFLIYS